MRPRISVVMPVYNCENYIANAIDSILNQSFQNFELIIIDGGSDDNTLRIIHGYKDKRIRIIEQGKKTPLIESLNQGIYEAKGNIIARQDADDLSHSQRLAKQYAMFCFYRDLAVLGTFYCTIDKDGRVLKKKFLKRHVTFADLKEGNQLCHGSIMFRKDIVLKEGLYDPLFQTCEDYELYCRLSLKGYKIANLNEFLYYLRLHESSVSTVKWQEQILYACLVKDIYFGNLKKETVKKLPIKDHKHLYSILSFEGKKDYHLSLALKYIKSKKYGKGLNEFLKIAKLNPKEANRLIIKTIQNPRKIFNKTD